jgi:hypothetical protein
MTNPMRLLGFAFTDPLKQVAEPLAESVRSAVFQSIRDRALWLLIPVTGMVFVVVSLGYGKVPFWALALWGCSVLSLTTGRWLFLRYLEKSADLFANKLNKLTFVQFISGLTHALALLGFPLLSAEERAIISILYLGLAIGNVGVTSGYIPMAWAYQIPLMGTLALSWTAYSEADESRLAALGLVVLMLVLVFIIVTRAKMNLITLIQSIDSQMKLAAANNSLQNALEKAESCLLYTSDAADDM